MRAAVCWSSQKPGADIWASSSAARAASESGSKVITDPGELGPDLLQLLVERLRLLGHGMIVASPVTGHSPCGTVPTSRCGLDGARRVAEARRFFTGAARYARRVKRRGTS